MRSHPSTTAIPCLVFILSLIDSASADIYQTDFTENPGWATDQPADYSWDSTNHWYHVIASNTAPGYKPNRFFGHILPDPVGAFTLRWDIQMTQNDWSAGVDFGMYDSGLKMPSYSTGPQGLDVSFSPGGGGQDITLWAYGIGGEGHASSNGHYSVGQWYSCVLGYDPSVGIANLIVKNQETKAIIYTTSLTISGGGFSNPLIFLGGTRGGMGEAPWYYAGVNPNAVAQANIDNVSLSAGAMPPSVVPIPGAFVLGLLGLGTAGWRLRRHP